MRLLLFFIFFPLSAQTPWINIFVHGSTKVQWALCSLPKVMLDRIDDDATYAKAVRMVRRDPFFNNLQIIQESGLHPITPCMSGSCPQMLTSLYDQVRRLGTKEEQLYYTFGWTGLCSDKIRYEDAKKLYVQLGQELARLQAAGKTARVRILGFSHGGNIIMNLAAVREREPQLPEFQIDEAVLLAMPVLPDTKQLIASDMFKRVYHFYSPADAVQGSDFLSFKRFMSHQRLGEHPDNVVQIRVQLTRFVDGTNRKRPMSPGHIEMWHVGWADWYRPNFPLYPIPVVTLTPQLISILQRHPELGNTVTLDMYPQRGCMHMRGLASSGAGVKNLVVPFIEHEFIETMKTAALSYQPDKEYFEKGTGLSYDAISFARASKNGALVKDQRNYGSRHNTCKRAMCLN